MKMTATEIPEVLIFEPRVFSDERGFFFESFNQMVFQQALGRTVNFVQDNHSKSSYGVLRGLHFQRAEHVQEKLVRCVVGAVFDVAVDIRPDSPTFAKWVGVNLSAENKLQLWIPGGFAHGFVVLSDTAEIIYKASNYYQPLAEGCILWSDPDIGIEWPISKPPELSVKDKGAALLHQALRPD